MMFRQKEPLYASLSRKSQTNETLAYNVNLGLVIWLEQDCPLGDLNYSLCRLTYRRQRNDFLLTTRSRASREGSSIGEIIRELIEALRLIGTGNTTLSEIILLSLYVSGVALLISSVVGIPAGVLLGLNRFRGRRLAVALIYTGMAFPPVVVGLFVYLMLSRNGPLGSLPWPWLPNLFTPAAMIVAQTIIAFPLVAGFTMAAVNGVDPALRLQVRAMGASRWQTTWAILEEARAGVIVSIVAGFGGIISEVGAVMMVGGNIEHRTRVLTTAIVLETNKGNFELAIALSLVLLGLAFFANAVIVRLQGRSFDR